MESIRFDDIEKLKSKISKDFGPWSEPIDVTQEKINQFADVTGDHQWIHIDIERCKKESPFGGPVAHGFLTLSLLPAFQTKAEWNVVGFRNVINYGGNKLRFISPVPAGAKVHAHSRIVARRGASARHPGDAGNQRPCGRQRSARADLRGHPIYVKP